ncbi:MAG: sel1 repeat family protein [Paludibacteraceae bacterium]|nr:sel1 repeat family protein [Paludibacteraceae bacterium]
MGLIGITKSRLRTIIISVSFVILIVISVLFKVYDLDQVWQQILAAVIAAIITIIVTNQLLDAQTSAESKKEKDSKVFEEKLKIYSEFLDKLNQIIVDNKISSEEEKTLIVQVSKIAMHTNTEHANEIIRLLQECVNCLPERGGNMSPARTRNLGVAVLNLTSALQNELYQDELISHDKSKKPIVLDTDGFRSFLSDVNEIKEDNEGQKFANIVVPERVVDRDILVETQTKFWTELICEIKRFGLPFAKRNRDFSIMDNAEEVRSFVNYFYGRSSFDLNDNEKGVGFNLMLPIISDDKEIELVFRIEIGRSLYIGFAWSKDHRYFNKLSQSQKNIIKSLRAIGDEIDVDLYPHKEWACRHEIDIDFWTGEAEISDLDSAIEGFDALKFDMSRTEWLETVLCPMIFQLMGEFIIKFKHKVPAKDTYAILLEAFAEFYKVTKEDNSSIPKAMKLFSLIASVNSSYQFVAGYFYYNACSCIKDDATIDKYLDTSVSYLISAAQNDSNEAKVNILYLYISSPLFNNALKRNAEKYNIDLNLLLKWSREAADEGDILAQNNLGRLYSEGLYDSLRDKEIIYPNYVVAYKYAKKAAEQGSAMAMCSLSKFYLEGIGTKINYKKAIKWINKSIEQNVPQAYLNLAICYEMGYSCEQDLPKAISIYQDLYDGKYDAYDQVSVNISNTMASFHLGVIYLNGRGVEADEEKAIRFLYESTESNAFITYFVLGIVYLVGIGVEKDEEKSFSVFSSVDDFHANLLVSVCYRYGLGIEKSQEICEEIQSELSIHLGDSELFSYYIEIFNTLKVVIDKIDYLYDLGTYILETALDYAKRKSPTSWAECEILRYLAELNLEKGEEEQGYGFIEQALELNNGEDRQLQKQLLNLRSEYITKKTIPLND